MSDEQHLGTLCTIVNCYELAVGTLALIVYPPAELTEYKPLGAILPFFCCAEHVKEIDLSELLTSDTIKELLEGIISEWGLTIEDIAEFGGFVMKMSWHSITCKRSQDLLKTIKAQQESGQETKH